MVEFELEELGLTKNEEKAYKLLVERGKLGAGDISKFSNVPYSRIYDVLASLEQKGFVKIIPEKTKKFVASNPDELTKIIESKKESLDKIKAKINEMKKLHEIKEKNPVTIGYGRPAFYKTVKEMKDPEKYDYSIKWTSEYRPDWVGRQKERIKQGKDIKVLARYDNETKSNVDNWLKINKKIKKFHNEGTALSIKDDEEVMISLINSNMTLLIKDKSFAKVMKQLFLDSYKNAEDIK